MRKTTHEQPQIHVPEDLVIPPCFCGAAAELVHIEREARHGQIHFYGVKCAKNHRIPVAFGSAKSAVKFWSDCLKNHR